MNLEGTDYEDVYPNYESEGGPKRKSNEDSKAATQYDDEIQMNGANEEKDKNGQQQVAPAHMHDGESGNIWNF